MKGVLSLVMCATALAFSDFLTLFQEGFQTGLQESAFCAHNPRECGRDLSLLASAVRPLQKDLKLTGGSIDIDIHDLENFFAGLIQGLELPDVGPDACSNDLTIASYAASQFLAAILNDYNTRSFDVFQLIDVSCAFLPAIYLPYESDCNFSSLWQKLQNTKIETLIMNYVGNSCDINEAFTSIANCRNDPQDCGYGIGTIIREEIAWGI